MSRRSGVEWVFVGLGANLGDASGTVRAALKLLGKLPDTTLIASSSLYRTAPVEATGPDYINAVAELRTRLTPRALFSELMTLEQGFGRQRPFCNAPRSLDLDLLLFGEREINSHRLRVPHPRMWQRAFVLAPLAELAPDLRCADGRSIAAGLAGLADQQVVRVAGSSSGADA